MNRQEWFLTEDFGLSKGREQLGLATYIFMQLPETLMELPEITISLPYCYLKRQKENARMDPERKLTEESGAETLLQEEVDLILVCECNLIKVS